MAHPQTSRTSQAHIGRPRCSIVIDGDQRELAGDINKSPNMPLKMKRLIQELGLTTREFAEHVLKADGSSVSRSTICLTLNKGYIPATVPNYKEQVESFMRGKNATEDEVSTMWQRDGDNVIALKTKPALVKKRDQFSETLKEAEMLTPTTMKHFHLFRNPFLDDVQQTSDVFMSESHQYAYAAMIDAAHNGGFVAICGECGAGKSILRRKLISELDDSGDVRVIQPQIVDKNDLTASHILDSIILDLDPNATPKTSKEKKARQVRESLLASSRGGMRHVLIIEEAHDLSVPMMKQLKRLWEIEDGYRKVLGIVLVGQTELHMRLNRNTHPEMREVILRCLIGTLDPLNRSDCEKYISLKLERVGKKASEVLEPDCADMVMARLTSRNNNSAVYPLYINNLLAKAMNAAAQIGAPRVNADIIKEV